MDNFGRAGQRLPPFRTGQGAVRRYCFVFCFCSYTQLPVWSALYFRLFAPCLVACSASCLVFLLAALLRKRLGFCCLCLCVLLSLDYIPGTRRNADVLCNASRTKNPVFLQTAFSKSIESYRPPDAFLTRVARCLCNNRSRVSTDVDAEQFSFFNLNVPVGWGDRGE